MANVFTTEATLEVAALLNGADRANAGVQGGKTFNRQVKKTAYTGATADPLYLCYVPAGTLFLPHMSSIIYTDPGDALTGKIGLFSVASTPIAIDDDAYGAGLALGGSAGTINLGAAATIGDSVITPARTTVDAWLVVTWTTATNAASHAQYWNLVFA